MVCKNEHFIFRLRCTKARHKVSVIIIIIVIRVMELGEDACLPVNDPVHGGHWAPGADCVREEGGTQRTETGDLAESSCSGRR